MHQILGKIIHNVESVIRGKRDAVEAVVAALICGGHVLIEDVPGVGKTRLIVALAKSINASFGRVQFTPDVLPSDITGFSMFNPKTREFEYRPGVIMNEFLLGDEINRTSPKTQSSLLEAMEERQVTIDGVTYPLPELFMVMATQNPIENTSTSPLPEAQLDRFLMKISIGYPERRDELEILYDNLRDPHELAAVARVEHILELRKELKKVYISRQLAAYIVSFVAATRTHSGIQLGASVRGTLALAQVAKACALLDNREYVIPDDIHRWLEAVLSHRMILKRGAAYHGVTLAQAIGDIKRGLSVPK
ncbi:MAG: MoxR family ATPase [Oscillospiraceae bacterium]|nr:MoxR family ATPase [Oscillospiraceae bacterium]